MKALLLLTLISVIVLSNHAQTQNNYYLPKYSTVLDPSVGSRCLHQCSRPAPEHVDGFYRVSKSDSVLLIQNFKKLLKVKPSKHFDPATMVKQPETFGYQYLGVVIDKKKYIYINAFDLQGGYKIMKYKKWTSVPMITCGGGGGYWGCLFNIDNTSFSDLNFNSGM